MIHMANQIEREKGKKISMKSPIVPTAPNNKQQKGTGIREGLNESTNKHDQPRKSHQSIGSQREQNKPLSENSSIEELPVK